MLASLRRSALPLLLRGSSNGHDQGRRVLAHLIPAARGRRRDRATMGTIAAQMDVMPPSERTQTPRLPHIPKRHHRRFDGRRAYLATAAVDDVVDASRIRRSPSGSTTPTSPG
jgi:hypothetical protein